MVPNKYDGQEKVIKNRLQLKKKELSGPSGIDKFIGILFLGISNYDKYYIDILIYFIQLYGYNTIHTYIDIIW